MEIKELAQLLSSHPTLTHEGMGVPDRKSASLPSDFSLFEIDKAITWINAHHRIERCFWPQQYARVGPGAMCAAALHLGWDVYWNIAMDCVDHITHAGIGPDPDVRLK